MLALLFAIALIALTLFVVFVAGVVIAVVTGLALLNVFAVILGVTVRRRRSRPSTETWRPSSFPPPEPADEPEERLPSLTIHRQ
jgi:hypothetical protein